jgi:hypothetical protein
MRSSELYLQEYNTDKIKNKYLEQYDFIFDPYVNNQVKLLEIGIHKGGSLMLWHDYFRMGTIVGIDIKLPDNFNPTDRIYLYEGNQEDLQLLSRVADEKASEGFDIIIDDASHVGESSKKTFWHLFEKHLKVGGIYAIEDWGTGYWNDWPDGMSYAKGKSIESNFWNTSEFTNKDIKIPYYSHNYGMVGLVKQLVDELGAPNITRGRMFGTPKRFSKFERITITPSIVFIKKGSDYSLNKEIPEHCIDIFKDYE